MPIGTKNEKIKSSVRHYAFYRAFERALEQQPGFKHGGMGTIGLVVPQGSNAGDYQACAVAFLFNDVARDEWDNLGYALFAAGEKPERMTSEFNEKCSKKERALVISEIRELPPLIAVALDAVIVIDDIGEDDLREACAQVLKLSVTAKQAKRLLSFPRDLMFAALRRNTSMTDTIRRLETLSPGSLLKRPIVEEGLRLEDLHGYGAAKDWGLQLAKDLEAWRIGQLKWSDVDRGLLLSGPPGVGKTIFAKALAATCGVNFVATSIVQWQAKGHLGDLLKAMRADFASAVNQAPSILLLDELDSVGDRQTFTGEHASYSIQVVNGLLEALDGTTSRDGVVVIGATNFPEKIDAAVRRPGRLDKHVAIQLPSQTDRVAILRQMLGDAAPVDLVNLGPATEGMAGADLAQTVRNAKKLARRQERELTAADLAQELPNLIPVEGAFRHAVAVHEVGHAVVGSTLNIGEFVSLSVSKQINPRFAVQSGGQASFFIPVLLVRNAQRYRDEICFHLGGIAAERVIFGSHGNGAGIGPTSDLAIATNLALQMETQMGMGARLHHFGFDEWHAFGAPSVSWPMAQVDKILREELARAETIVISRREAILRLAKDLENVGILTAVRFDELYHGTGAAGSVSANRPPPNHPEEPSHTIESDVVSVRAPEAGR